MWRVRRKKDADSSVRTPPLFWLLPPDSLDSRIPQGYPGRSPWLVGSRCGRRQFHDGQPEILNGGDCPDELDHGDGLGDVAVGVEVVGAEDVPFAAAGGEDHHGRSEEHTSELQSLTNLVCRLLLEKKKHKSE